MATINCSQHIKTSAEYFIFKGLQNSSFPGGPKWEAFHGIHEILGGMLF